MIGGTRTFILALLIAQFWASPGYAQSTRSLFGDLLEKSGLVNRSDAERAFDAGSQLIKAAEALTEEQEYFLGRSVAAMILGKTRPLRNREVNRYVSKVGTLVAAVSDRPNTFNGYHFIVLDTDELNAMATPGGFVFITRGLFSILPGEDALASVLAHEIAHVVRGHGVKAVSQSKMSAVLLHHGEEIGHQRAGKSGYGVQKLTELFSGSVNDVADAILVSGYGRGQEKDADEYTVDLLVRAGYRPEGFVDMLSALEEVSGGHSSTGLFATHPSPEVRLKKVKKLVGKLDKSAVGKESEKRVARFQRIKKSLS